jgi:hypothetical protein
MPDEHGFMECDPEYAEAAERQAAEGAVQYLYDREIRMRVGALIARAMQAAQATRQRQPAK